MKNWCLTIAFTLCSTLLLFNKTWAARWDFKREITVTNSGDRVKGAVVLIQINNSDFDYTKAKADGADVRFSVSKTLKGNGLNYWTEQWDKSGLTRIWVKLPELKAKERLTINMFYGNTSAEPVSNGEATFLFFDDFESGDFTKKWTNVSIGDVVEQGGNLKLKETDGQDGIITANFNVTGKMIIRTEYQRGNADEHWTRAGIGGWDYFLCFGDHTEVAGTGTNYVMLYDKNSLLSLKAAPLVKAANKIITDKWRKAAFWYDGSNLKGMQDDVTISWPAASNLSSKLSLRTLDNDAWDNFAFITVSPYVNVEPTVAIGEEQKV
ncbi:MAG: DUF2341 domain-containing protein [Mucilaginibacter sp.]|uniref:DUF2341 domain-containing protein n=1 Tax=Mucilaginibacter sp. TaxID=1882438 RepID=UPI0034E5DF53